MGSSESMALRTSQREGCLQPIPCVVVFKCVPLLLGFAALPRLVEDKGLPLVCNAISQPGSRPRHISHAAMLPCGLPDPKYGPGDHRPKPRLARVAQIARLTALWPSLRQWPGAKPAGGSIARSPRRSRGFGAAPCSLATFVIVCW